MHFLIYLCLLLVTPFAGAYPEKGKWTFPVDQNAGVVGVTKSLQAGSQITVKITCRNANSQVRVLWMLRHSPCWQEYLNLDNENPGQLRHYLNHPEDIPEWLNYSAVKYLKGDGMDVTCDGSSVILPEVNKTMTLHVRKVRASKTEHPLYTVSKEGLYLLVIQIEPFAGEGIKSDLTYTGEVSIDMKSSSGYLSASDWPMLPFYATMCAVYTILGIVWLLVCFCRWRDILRMQIWIGAVLFLGMLEMAVYLAEYESLNNTGELTEAAEYAAELLSCVKRGLARILVLIASMGFGIVKPRLGAMLQKIVGVGVMYMVLSSIEAHMKLVQPKNVAQRGMYFASFMLALLDAAICFWIFSSLVQTTRTLRLRRNAVKLSLYYHFTNTLVFSVIASLIFMAWSIYYHQAVVCLTDWKELWLDEAFWKFLFSLLLMVIMILWRPSNNNQVYAFTPLLDSGDEDEDEIVANDHLEGMKMRVNRANAGTPSPRPREDPSIEDDLKWVEENIPSSVVEAGLPLLDSEEEIMTTRFELSKMQ